MSPSVPRILCFGEVLWDCVPRGLFLGGAPANVVYHLTRLGCRASLVSAVGNDFLGQEALRRVTGWGVDAQFISISQDKQTGVVLVDLTDPAHPSYEIVRDVAWDHIAASDDLDQTVRTASALVFGTLAVREDHNRRLLDHLISQTNGLKVFDVNLRPPFVDRELTLSLGKRSDLIKLNEDELGALVPGSENNGLENRAKRLSDETGCRSVCVTCGAKGAALLLDGKWHWTDAKPIAVKDAIGAGDAFLAALIAGLLDGTLPPENILTRAARLAEFVAASDGATPAYNASDMPFLQVHSA